MLALAELARIDDDERYRKAFTNLWWSIVRLDRHNNGGFSSGEQAQGNPYHPGAIETCCTIAWMAMTVEMLRLTGDPIAADELELSTLNSAMGLFSPSGAGAPTTRPWTASARRISTRLCFRLARDRPSSTAVASTRCGLGLLSEWALMRATTDDSLVLNWYGPGVLRTRMASGTDIVFTCRTDYPRTGLVRITVAPDGPTRFLLRLRIPHWSRSTTIKVNGENIRDVKPASYLELARTWKPGDVIEMVLDLSPHVWTGERGCTGRVSLYRGPILLTYDPRFNAGGPSDPAPIDLSKTNLSVSSWKGTQPPILLVEARTPAGSINLCDFASAGFDGSPYRSWLRAEHASPVAFRSRTPLAQPALEGRPVTRRVFLVPTMLCGERPSRCGGVAQSPCSRRAPRSSASSWAGSESCWSITGFTASPYSCTSLPPSQAVYIARPPPASASNLGNSPCDSRQPGRGLATRSWS